MITSNLGECFRARGVQATPLSPFGHLCWKDWFAVFGKLTPLEHNFVLSAPVTLYVSLTTVRAYYELYPTIIFKCQRASKWHPGSSEYRIMTTK